MVLLTVLVASSAADVHEHVDNGDGTLSHPSSGLMWEKKVGADDLPNQDDLHDADNRYDASATAAWIASLNAARFAGHADWRLPTRTELELAMPAAGHPVRSSALTMFHAPACRRGCADLAAASCSCVAIGDDAFYRTSTAAPSAGKAAVVALGYRAEEAGLSVREAVVAAHSPARAVRTMTPAQVAAANAAIAAQPRAMLPNEIYAGVVQPRSEEEAALCRQGCSNRFLRDRKGDVLVLCLEKCKFEVDDR